MGLSDFEKANITQICFCAVTIIYWVYCGWIAEFEDGHSTYFAGALDAMHYAQESSVGKKIQDDEENQEKAKRDGLSAAETRKSIISNINASIPRPSAQFRESLSHRQSISPRSPTDASTSVELSNIETGGLSPPGKRIQSVDEDGLWGDILLSARILHCSHRSFAKKRCYCCYVYRFTTTRSR